MNSKKYEKNVIKFYNEVIKKIVSVLDPETIEKKAITLAKETIDMEDRAIETIDIINISKILIIAKNSNEKFSPKNTQFEIVLSDEYLNISIANSRDHRYFLFDDYEDSSNHYSQIKHWYCNSDSNEPDDAINSIENFEDKVEAVIRLLSNMPPKGKKDELTELIEMNKKLDMLIKLLSDKSEK